MHFDDRDETEWTADERAELRALPAERTPDADLRRRTAAALHHRGLLRSEPVGSRRGPWIRRAFTIAAAASVVFIAGGAAGYRLAATRLAAREAAASVRLANESTPPGATPDTTAHIVWF